MTDQSALTNSTLNISNTLIISGTKCTLTHSTLRLLPAATGTLLGVAPVINATLSLNQSSLLENNGVLSLGDGSGIGSDGEPPQSRVQISSGALVVATNLSSITGSATNHLIIDNNGILRCEKGTLQLGPGLDWQSSGGTGEFNAGSISATLDFSEPLKVEAGVNSLFSGPGKSRWLNGATLVGEAQISGNVEISDAVSGQGRIQVLGGLSPGTLNWLNGKLSLAGVNIDVGGVLLINPAQSNTCELAGCLINNAGACRWLGQGSSSAGAGATLNNLPGATLELQTDANWVNSAPPLVIINNAGLLLKSAGNGQSSLAADFLNSGNLEIKAGSLRFLGSWTQTAGSTIVDAGTLLGGTTLNVQGGIVSGLGTIDAGVVNGGLIGPGNSVGLLTVAKDYQQTAAGILSIEIGGAAPGVQSDELIIGGAANLAGRLQLSTINGYSPQPGETFQILTCAAQTGSFTFVDSSPVPGTVWVPRYNGTNITVALANTVSFTAPILSQGVINLPFNTTTGLTYIVQATESLSSPNWQTLATIPGNGSIKAASDSVSGAQRFYRVLVQ